MDTIQFLQKIFEYADVGYSQVFALPSATGRSFPVDQPELAPSLIADLLQQNVYFSAGICAESKNEKWNRDDIIGIPALWADIDIYNPAAHKAPNLPKTVEEAMSLLPDQLPPSIVVHSGYGLQAWWLLREVWMFETPEEKTQAQQMLKNVQAHIRERGKAHGWHLDSVPDLPRVMRLPGTWNHKIAGQPVAAQVIESSDIRYNQSDIEEILPLIVSDAAPRTERNYTFERRPTDGPATLMLQNCNFLQHWHLNYKTLPEPIWMAAIANLVRGIDGEVIITDAAKAWLGPKYDHNKTIEKLEHAINDFHGPHSCEYIRDSLGFGGCPSGGCDIQAPCGWSLARVPQAKALIRSIAVPTAEVVYRPEILTAAAILEKDAPAEYDVFWQKLSGQVNKNTYRKELAKHKREQAGFTVIDGGQSGDVPPADDEGQRWLNQVVPDLPVQLVLPNNGSKYVSWRFGPNGVGMLRVSEKGETFSEAAYTPVVISERIYNVDSQQEKAKVTFKTDAGNWRSVTLPKSTIFNAKNIICLANSGLNVTSETAKNLVKWLSALEASNGQMIPVKKGVSKMGWRDNESTFILPGIDNEYSIDIGDDAAKSVVAGLGQGGNFDTWKKSIWELRTRPKARFILAASFASPLLKIVGQRSFLIHNWDTSRGGKSATLFAALSIWGRPAELTKAFSDSQTSMERTAALFTDLPLGVNEYELLSEQEKKSFDSMVYMISEGKGRGRATKDGLQETVQWRTIALLTGESQITRSNSRGGVFTRLIELRGGPIADDDLFASSLYDLTAKHYGHAGKLFVENLIQADPAELQDIYKKTRLAFRAKHKNKLESHLDAMACIALADYLASQWIFGADKETAARESIVLTEGIIAEIVTKAEADEAERAWEWMLEWVASNEGRFLRNYSAKQLPVIMGYIENGHINIIKNELVKALKEEGFSANKVLSAWADEGRFPCGMSSGKRTFGMRSGRPMNGLRPYVVQVKMKE